MKPVQEMLAKYKISFKTLVASWAVVVTTFYGNAAFHAFVVGAYAKVPSGVKGVIVGVGPVLVALYKARKELVASTTTTVTATQTVVTPEPPAPVTK